MAYDILALIDDAARQGHDERHLRAEMVDRLSRLWGQLPRKPVISDRVRRRLENDHLLLDIIDTESVITAMTTMFGSDPTLRADLAKLTFVVARLGGTVCTIRVGQDLMRALRACTGEKRPPAQSPDDGEGALADG